MKSKAVCILSILTVLLFSGIALSVSDSHDAHPHPHSHPDSHHEGASHSHGNPLLEEMVILDNAFREVVSGVALGDGKRIHTALESMHGTMERTHEGVHAGTVRIPKNGERMEEFVMLDREFHHMLEELAHTAHESNDWHKMLNLTKQLLDGCVGCHQTFRD